MAEDLQVKGLSQAADSSYYGESSAKSGRRRHAPTEKPPKPAKKIRSDNGGDSMGSDCSKGNADMDIKTEPEGAGDLESAHHSSIDEGHHDDPSDRSGYFDDDYRYGDFEEGTSDSKGNIALSQ